MNIQHFVITVLAAALIGFAILTFAPGTSASGRDDGEASGVIVAPSCDVFEDDFEDNDSQGAAERVKLPFGANDLQSCDGDEDWFAFSAAKDAQIDIHLDFDNASGDIDMTVFDPSGDLLINSVGIEDDEDISWPANESGIFTLQIRLFDDPTGLGNDYDIEIDVGCPAAGVFGSTYTDALSEPLPFPDFTAPGATSCITISEDAIINDMWVGVDISHPNVGDVRVTLRHVDTGTEILLIDRPGVPASALGCAGNDILVVLTDGAAAGVENVCDASAPTIEGTFRPAISLAAFDGESLEGEWRIQVTDLNFGNVGELNRWSLVADLIEPTDTPVPPEGLIGDGNCDGTVNAIDAALILQVAAGLLDSMPCPQNADANQSGDVNAIDAALILQFSAGLIADLPP